MKWWKEHDTTTKSKHQALTSQSTREGRRIDTKTENRWVYKVLPPYFIFTYFTNISILQANTEMPKMKTNTHLGLFFHFQRLDPSLPWKHAHITWCTFSIVWCNRGVPPCHIELQFSTWQGWQNTPHHDLPNLVPSSPPCHWNNEPRGVLISPPHNPVGLRQTLADSSGLQWTECLAKSVAEPPKPLDSARIQMLWRTPVDSSGLHQTPLD